MEASTLQAPAGLTRTRIAVGAPLLRLRSDEQLVALFRAGNDEAFRVIHDRYRQRLFAYTRQMMPESKQDAEDAVQEVFVRAYCGLRASDRELALRAWLYRVAHNRCIDELRRPALPAPEVLGLVRCPIQDPIAQAEQRESLRRLIADLRRLPDQQRSALLMRELSGMSYAELAGALGVSIPAVKSLLVRARVGLARAEEARDTACSEIRDELLLAHDRRVRPKALARRHLHDCAGCRQFRREVRSVSRELGALVPALGPVAALAKLLGIGGGTSGGAAAGSGAVGGAACAGGAASTGGIVAAGSVLATGAGHVATLLAAVVVTAGGALELEHTITAPAHHRAPSHRAPAGGSPVSGGLPTAFKTAGGPGAAPANANGSASAPAAARTPRAGSSPAGSATGASSSATSPAATGSYPGTPDGSSGLSANGPPTATSSGPSAPSKGTALTGTAVPGASSSSTPAVAGSTRTPAPATGATPGSPATTSGASSGGGSQTGSSSSPPSGVALPSGVVPASVPSGSGPPASKS